ncbi:MAG: DUF1289 domain-containing protein [Pseudomonadota bacterium]
MSHLPSPCLDICKFKLRGHCIACGMTRSQKQMFKSIMGHDAQMNFIKELMEQQARVGSARTWPMEYVRQCEKRGIEPPFDLAGE